mmetsp:Transcript_39846/g.78548  ORF Transcript_39846/g.78548 Transcript_39846/m.78548 type:complete len:96 (-) Transcript_39846:2366-2653(-)
MQDRREHTNSPAFIPKKKALSLPFTTLRDSVTSETPQPELSCYRLSVCLPFLHHPHLVTDCLPVPLSARKQNRSMSEDDFLSATLFLSARIKGKR